MDLSKNERNILRELAAKKAEIADLLIQKERKELWTKLNNLEKTKPMIWLDEICWNEVNVNDELTLKTTDSFCQKIETQLRQEIYLWNHIQCDMIVEPVIYSPYVINDSGFGITENVDIVRTDETNDIVSRRYKAHIASEEDIEKIKMPVVSYNHEKTEENYQVLKEIFDGIISVEKRGAPGFWFAPWDMLVSWTGVEKILIALIERPEYVHKLVDRLLTASLCRLDQYEKLGLLASNNCNIRVGSGAYGYTSELPQPDKTKPAFAKDMWGCSTAQIFTSVSPKMHWEFALQYEIRCMERFGLNYYGCCEPLHNKMNILKEIPRLRKISMSPWANIPKARESGADNYVLSIKPPPAIFAEDEWSHEKVRAELENLLSQAEGACAEVVMKDISTVRYQPKRLWDWAKIASEVSEQFA
ncbi:MAG: hypothetical protein ABIH42_00300 [Planctomycetota bacterium]